MNEMCVNVLCMSVLYVMPVIAYVAITVIIKINYKKNNNNNNNGNIYIDKKQK